MLPPHTKYQRAQRAKQRRIAMLCDRLDRHVAFAERFRAGKVRTRHLAIAAATREQLRQIDH